MSKYQEALDFLNTRCNVANRKNYFMRKEAVVTLQKLIDKYSKDSCECPFHIVDEIREQLNVTERLAEKLAKALNKACSILAKIDCDSCEVCYVVKNNIDCSNEKEWKEFLLKDE